MTTTSATAEQAVGHHRAPASQLPAGAAGALAAEQRALAAAGQPSGPAQPGTRPPDGGLLDAAGHPATPAQTPSGKPAVATWSTGRIARP